MYSLFTQHATQAGKSLGAQSRKLVEWIKITDLNRMPEAALQTSGMERESLQGQESLMSHSWHMGCRYGSHSGHQTTQDRLQIK